jgi:diguanylate cyclase (GGDEF)-like protein
MHLIRRILPLLLACLSVPVSSSATSTKLIDVENLGRPHIDTFDTGNGLPDLSLLSISATPDGHIWAGTMRGLARFNGIGFVPVELPGIADSSGMIRSVLAMDNQNVWSSAPNGGVYLWNGRQWRHFRPGAEFPGKDVRRLRAFNTREGQRVFATTNQGQVAVWNGQHWSEFSVRYPLQGKEIFDLHLIPGARAEQDVVWIATYNAGLIRCQGLNACVESKLPGDRRFNEVSSLRSVRERDGSTSLWAGSYGGGVARLRDGQWQRFNAKDGALSGDYVHDMEVVNNGSAAPEIWFGTRNGLVSYHNGLWRRYDSEDNWFNSRVRGLASSRDDDSRPQLWAATDNGATRLHLRGDWRTVRRLSEYGNGVWAVRFETTEADAERLWLGSDGDGLWRYELGQWTQFTTADGLQNNIVRSITRLRSGHLWIGQWDGYLAEQSGERFRTIETPWIKSPQQAVNVFLNDSSGGIWVGLRKGGLARYDGRNWQYFDSAHSAAPEFVLGLAETAHRGEPVIWASSKGKGLGRYYRGQWRVFNTGNSAVPDDELINAQLIPDAQKRPVLWIGTQSHGLIRLDVSDIDKPVLVTTPALPKPPHPYVYGAVQNSRGDMVVCSDYGVAHWVKAGGAFRVIEYHRSNGLPHDECNAGALSIDRYGRAWIGTIGGAAVLAMNKGPSRIAPLHLESLRFGNRAQPLRVQSGQYQADEPNAGMDVEFALLTGERESESLYRTQLIGLQDRPGEWQKSNQRSFTNLPSGDYTLRVEAKDYTGVAAPPLSIRIRIPTPWWRSWWALALAAAGFILALVILIRWRERQLRAQQTQLMHLVEKRTGQLERRGKELHRINEELRHLSYHDVLTGVANRRKLLEALESAVQQATRNHSDIAFILLDVDDFKSINDTYGHLHGDQCLQQIAQQLELTLRDYICTLGRYGGEEFAVVLPNAGAADAVLVAERCRMAIEKLRIPHAGRPIGFVTLSLGVASIRAKQGELFDGLIKKADAALYLAKQSGKNRVVSAN